MILPSLPKKFPTAMLVSLLVNGALLGQGGWEDDGTVVIGVAKTAIEPWR